MSHNFITFKMSYNLLFTKLTFRNLQNRFIEKSFSKYPIGFQTEMS